MPAYVLMRVKDYYKYEYQNWTQPVLTVNGTLGGNSFAVSSNLSDFYKAFDNNNDSYINGFNENCWFTFYNPNPLKVSAIEMLSTGAAYMPRAGTLEYSDNNATWVKVFDWNSNSANPYTMTVDAGYHKYWKVTVVTKGSSIGNADIASVKITATEQITVKGSATDYDFRTSKAYVLKRKRPTEYRKKVIDTSTTGTYTFDVVKERIAKIILVGGGGGGGQVWSSHAAGSGGGSGACVYIKTKLQPGTYTITCGKAGPVYSNPGGNSTLVKNGVTLITANGGAGGGGGGNPPGNGGTYTISDNIEILEEIIVSNGNRGTQGTLYVSGVGGASVYKDHGRGGNDRSNGIAGYVFVELETDKDDYTYKINTDKCYVLKRKQYWKYQYQNWTQPVLTSDGIIGSNSFATSQTSLTESGYEAFRAFDNNTSTVCLFAKSTGYFQWYNPNPLKITNMKLTNFAGDAWGTRALTAGSIQVSNNGSDFVELKTFTNSATGGGANWNIDLSTNTGYYKYYRIVCTGTSYAVSNAANQCHIAELKITATEQITVKATKNDYDFVTD